MEIPNGHEIHPKSPPQGLNNIPKIGIFGLEINHLATLLLICCLVQIEKATKKSTFSHKLKPQSNEIHRRKSQKLLKTVILYLWTVT
jgi:hypothetical protein